MTSPSDDWNATREDEERYQEFLKYYERALIRKDIYYRVPKGGGWMNIFVKEKVYHP